MNDTSFGMWLRRRRKMERLSLRDLGQRADLDDTYLSKVEAGKVPPPTDEAVRRLARTLGDEDGVGAALAAQERRLPIRTIRAVLAAYPEIADHIERLARETGCGVPRQGEPNVEHIESRQDDMEVPMKREQAEERARALGHPLTSWWPSTLYQEAHAACRCGAVTATEFVPYSRDGRGSYVVLTEPAREERCQATNDTRRTSPPATGRRHRTAAQHSGAATREETGTSNI